MVQMPGIRFRGIMGYEGHAVLVPDFEDKKRIALESATTLVEAAESLRANDVACEIVSAAGTGTYMITSDVPGITEIQAGSYVVMDTTYRAVVPDFDNALFVLSMVISRRGDDRIITDMGKKAATEEFGLPELQGVPTAKLAQLSEEHAKLDVLDPACSLRPGDKVQFIPSHCCTTINLHDEYFCIRDGKLEAIWPVDARGKVR